MQSTGTKTTRCIQGRQIRESIEHERPKSPPSQPRHMCGNMLCGMQIMAALNSSSALAPPIALFRGRMVRSQAHRRLLGAVGTMLQSEAGAGLGRAFLLLYAGFGLFLPDWGRLGRRVRQGNRLNVIYRVCLFASCRIFHSAHSKLDTGDGLFRGDRCCLWAHPPKPHGRVR